MSRDTKYNDWDEFDPEEYAWRCYGKGIMEVDQQLILGALEAIEALGVRPGAFSRAADVGAGPNFFPAMMLSPFVRHFADGGRIDLVEFSAPNREYLQRIVDGTDPTRLQGIWNKFEDFMADHSRIWRGALGDARRLARVVKGDIFKLQPETYDAVSSFFVADSIVDTREGCEKAIASLLSAVKPGGLVVIGHMLGSQGYPAGVGTWFPGAPLTSGDLHRIYDDKLEELTIVEPPLTNEVHEDYHGAAVVIGRKKRAGRVRIQDDTHKMFTTDGIESCLYDKQRTAYLRHAIFATVKPGDVVVNAGSGSGILGMFAAQAGASRVYCVELNPEHIDIIEQNARQNGFSERVVTICADATTVKLPEQVDVIISEIISGGFFYEPQLQVVSHLRQYLKPGGATVPLALTNYLELIDAQEDWFGVKLKHDSRYHTLEQDAALTTRSPYMAVDFRQGAAASVVANATVRAMRDGIANALRIPYAIQFSEGVLANVPTNFLLNPQVVFLPEPIELEAGAYYNVSLAYEASGSPLACKIAIKKQDSQRYL